MLRDLMVHDYLAVDATFAAASKMTTGAGVVKDFVSKTADFPADVTAANIMFVQKPRNPKGINASRTVFSDYDPDFVNVEEGELVVLYHYPADSTFATSEYDAASLTDENKGKRVAWGADGKATLATVESVYVFNGIFNDNGHLLAEIYVTDTPASN